MSLTLLHMKNEALFFSKDKSKTLKCHLLQYLFGALRVNIFKLLDIIYTMGKSLIRGNLCDSYSIYLAIRWGFPLSRMTTNN